MVKNGKRTDQGIGTNRGIKFAQQMIRIKRNILIFLDGLHIAGRGVDPKK